MSFILTSRTRSRQPQGVVQVRDDIPRPVWVSHPTAGVYSGGYPGGLTNLVQPGDKAVNTDANFFYTLGKGPGGFSIENATGTSTPRLRVTTSALCGATQLTLLCVLWRTGAVDVSRQWLNFRTGYEHTLDIFSSTSSTLTFGADWQGAWNGASQQTVTIGDGLVTIAAVIRQDGARFFCNGRFIGTKTGSAFTIGSTAYSVDILASAASPVLLQSAWKIALHDTQAIALTANPWQLFAPERTPVFYSIAGVSPGPSTANRIMLLRRPGLSRIWR